MEMALRTPRTDLQGIGLPGVRRLYSWMKSLSSELRGGQQTAEPFLFRMFEESGEKSQGFAPGKAPGVGQRDKLCQHVTVGELGPGRLKQGLRVAMPGLIRMVVAEQSGGGEGPQIGGMEVVLANNRAVRK
jgi:hypothetical protein